MTTPLKLRQMRIAVSAGKIIRLDMSSAPIMRIPMTTVTAVRTAMTLFMSCAFVPVARAKVSSKVHGKYARIQQHEHQKHNGGQHYAQHRVGMAK